MPVAILALLQALVPLIPTLAPQVEAIISEIKHNGEISPLAASQIHELALSIHQQVKDAETKRLGKKG